MDTRHVKNYPGQTPESNLPIHVRCGLNLVQGGGRRSWAHRRILGVCLAAQNRLKNGSTCELRARKNQIGSNRLKTGSKSARNRLKIGSNRLKIGSNRLKIGSKSRIGSKSAQNRIPESAAKSDPDSGFGHRRVLGVWALSPVGGTRWSRRVARGSD